MPHFMGSCVRSGNLSLRLEENWFAPRRLSRQNSLFEMPSAASVLAIDSLESFTVPVSARMASIVSGITMA